MSWLLDTNIVSEVRKPGADRRVRSWFEQVSGERLFLSVLVLGEIRQGVERLRPRDPKRADIFEEWLRVLKTDYRDRILDVDEEVAEKWGVLNAGSPLPAIDGLLAATALVHDLTLVTRNVGDVVRTGVKVLNPFDAGA